MERFLLAECALISLTYLWNYGFIWGEADESLMGTSVKEVILSTHNLMLARNSTVK